MSISSTSSTAAPCCLTDSDRPKLSPVSPLHPDFATLVVAPESSSPTHPQPASSAGAVLPAGKNDEAAKPELPTLETDRGPLQLDLDAYFTPHPGIDFDNPLTRPPLLLPSAQNIAALSEHVTRQLQQALATGQITALPASLSYDNEGKPQLPADYPQVESFQEFLKNNPALSRQLSTVSALASHQAAMHESIAFSNEYSAAKSNAARDAILAKYQDLFSGTRAPPKVSLEFTSSGQLNLKVQK